RPNNTVRYGAFIGITHVACLPLDHTITGLLIPGFGDLNLGALPTIQFHLKGVHPPVMLVSYLSPMLVMHQRVRANLLPLIQAHQMADTVLGGARRDPWEMLFQPSISACVFLGGR